MPEIWEKGVDTLVDTFVDTLVDMLVDTLVDTFSELEENWEFPFGRSSRPFACT